MPKAVKKMSPSEGFVWQHDVTLPPELPPNCKQEQRKERRSHQRLRDRHHSSPRISRCVRRRGTEAGISVCTYRNSSLKPPGCRSDQVADHCMFIGVLCFSSCYSDDMSRRRNVEAGTPNLFGELALDQKTSLAEAKPSQDQEPALERAFSF